MVNSFFKNPEEDKCIMGESTDEEKLKELYLLLGRIVMKQPKHISLIRLFAELIKDEIGEINE